MELAFLGLTCFIGTAGALKYFHAIQENSKFNKKHQINFQNHNHSIFGVITSQNNGNSQEDLKKQINENIAKLKHLKEFSTQEKLNTYIGSFNNLLKNTPPPPSSKYISENNFKIKSPNEIVSELPLGMRTKYPSSTNSQRENKPSPNNFTYSKKSQTNEKTSTTGSSKTTNSKTTEQVSIYGKAFHELLINNYKHPVDSEGIISISKRRNGEWFKCDKKLLSSRNIKSFNLKNMPTLRELTDKIDISDPDIKVNGGKVFLTEEMVYKICDGRMEVLKLTPFDSKAEELNVKIINLAIKTKKKLLFSYVNNKNIKSIRTILPLNFLRIKTSDVVYLEAFCEMVKDNRTFTVEKMRNLVII